MSTTTTTTSLPPFHTASLYPVVEDLTEYGCCPCDDSVSILGRFPLRDIAFPPSEPLDLYNQQVEKKHSRQSSSGFLKRRSRGSSFDDETTVTTENEEPVAKKFEEKYVLTRQIFACTQSQVWECVHRALGLRRCVKIIDLPLLNRSEVEACRREVSLLQKVQSHGAIVKLCEVYENRKIYLVMELATGGNVLSRVIQQEALPEDTVRRIAISVLQAIQHLQSFNLCHNDLQPSNLVLDGNDDVVLVDFGRSCAAGEELDQGALHTSYTSPEILNFNTCSPVSDIWSLGAVLYFCFFSQAPVPYSKRRSELTFPFRDQDEVSRQAKQFMSACLHHDPTVRMTAEEALSHPWLEQEAECKERFSWKNWWKKWFCKKEASNEILSPSTTESSGVGLSSLSFSWRH